MSKRWKSPVKGRIRRGRCSVLQRILEQATVRAIADCVRDLIEWLSAL